MRQLQQQLFQNPEPWNCPQRPESRSPQDPQKQTNCFCPWLVENLWIGRLIKIGGVHTARHSWEMGGFQRGYPQSHSSVPAECRSSGEWAGAAPSHRADTPLMQSCTPGWGGGTKKKAKQLCLFNSSTSQGQTDLCEHKLAPLEAEQFHYLTAPLWMRCTHWQCPRKAQASPCSSPPIL